MSRASLVETLTTVRKRISRSQGRRLNEENTKATLIEPVLRALGWDTEDVEEVQREFKIKRRDKPVDYGLLELRTPRLFLEAKALGENLDDRRWTNQIMGYAGVAGVEWIVLTDGNEYRIYNSHAPVAVEEKLFRTIRIADDEPVVPETLELLAKERMKENRIELLWRAHFVDRRVKAALDGLFASDSDMLLVNYISQQTKNLTAEEIRASLARSDVRVDFPMPSIEVLTGSVPSVSPKRKPASKATTPGSAQSSVGVMELIDSGILSPPISLERHYKGKRLSAEILPDGRIRCEGKTYDSLSTAGSVARATVTGLRPDGKLRATNGWTFWRYKLPTGEFVDIDHARQQLLKRRAA